MNKKITRSASLVAALLVAAALVFTGCPSSTDEEVTLSSISVDASSATTTYTVGDTFSSDGVVVTATYSDSTTGTIANSECTFTGHDISTAGTQTVTVTYKEKTATYEIKVSDPTTLSSIKVDANSAKTSYTVGDTFSSDNVVVTATYSNSTTGTVANSNCTFKG